jgi:hypothetical protein
MSRDRAKASGYQQPAMSVALSDILDDLGEAPERVLDDFSSTWGIAAFKAGDLRQLQPPVGICRDPLKGAPWHGLVFGKTRAVFKTEKMAIRGIATLTRLPTTT